MHYLSQILLCINKVCPTVRPANIWMANRQNDEMPSTNSSDELSVTNSRCIAVDDVQVKMITCASRSVFLFNLTCSGPNISSAVCENGGNQAATRILGNWPINWSRGFFRRLR